MAATSLPRATAAGAGPSGSVKPVWCFSQIVGSRQKGTTWGGERVGARDQEHATLKRGPHHTQFLKSLDKGAYSLAGTYVGDWRENKRHGYGKETTKSGDIYEGGWEEGARHGQGALFRRHAKGSTAPPQLFYKGDFAYGKRHGFGICYLDNGDV